MRTATDRWVMAPSATERHQLYTQENGQCAQEFGRENELFHRENWALFRRKTKGRKRNTQNPNRAEDVLSPRQCSISTTIFYLHPWSDKTYHRQTNACIVVCRFGFDAMRLFFCSFHVIFVHSFCLLFLVVASNVDTQHKLTHTSLPMLRWKLWMNPIFATCCNAHTHTHKQWGCE